MSYLTERFHSAVRTLVSDGPIKQRLSRAYAEHLAGLQEPELPAGLRKQFSHLEAALNRVSPIGKEGRARASVQKMSVAEAAAHADAILALYSELLGQGDRAEPLKVITTSDRPPRYLTNKS